MDLLFQCEALFSRSPCPDLSLHTVAEATVEVTFLRGSVWVGVVCAIRARAGRGGEKGVHRRSQVSLPFRVTNSSQECPSPCALRSCTGCAHFIFNPAGWVSRWLSGMTVERAAPLAPFPSSPVPSSRCGDLRQL